VSPFLTFQEEASLDGVVAAAWPLAQAIDARGIADPEETERLPWDGEEFGTPQVATAARGRLTLRGEVRLTVFLVDAPEQPLSRAMAILAVAQLQTALHFLATAEVNARLRFHCRLLYRSVLDPRSDLPTGNDPRHLTLLLTTYCPFPLPTFTTADLLVVNLDGGAWGAKNVHRLLVHLLAARGGAKPDPGPQERPGDRAECITKTNSLRFSQRARRQMGWAPPHLAFPLLLLHRGRHDDSLWFSTADGEGWSLDVQLPWHRSTTAPAFARAPVPTIDRWIAVYRRVSKEAGTLGKEAGTLHWCAFDGARWTAENALEGPPGHSAPALANFQNRLHCIDLDRQGWLRHRTLQGTPEDEGWSPPRYLPDCQSTHGPALAAFQDTLWCLYRGGDGWLHAATYDGESWSEEPPLPHPSHHTGGRPALATWGRKLVCAFRAPHGGGVRWSAWDGKDWTPVRDTGRISATPPALCVFFDGTADGRLYLVGTDPGDDHLWIASDRQDDEGWESPVHLPYHKCRGGAALVACREHL